MTEKRWHHLNVVWRYANPAHSSWQTAQVAMYLNEWGIKPGEVVMTTPLVHVLDYESSFPRGTVIGQFDFLVYTDRDHDAMVEQIKTIF